MYPFQALFILAVIPSMCKGLQEDNCNVIPKDPYIEVGSDTEIVCQTSCVHGATFWTLDNRYVDDGLSKTINSSHTVLSLRNFTHHVAALQCHSEDTKQVLGGTTVRTYTKPTSVSCILHYENQTMKGLPDLITCKWEHQVYSSLKVNYTVLSTSQSEICNSHETTCTSDYYHIGGEIPIDDRPNSITVRAKSAAWEAFSDRYEFTSLKILKITQPELNVTTISDHVLVSWKSRYVSSYQYRCQVKHNKVAHEGTLEDVIRSPEQVLNKWEMTIGEVESCRNYTFAVHCALIDAPWSDWSQERTIMTKLKKSDFKPRLWRKITEADKNGVRKVHAMWTEIPSECQDTFTYTIKQSPYKEHTTGGNYAAALCYRSVCDVNQDAHRINLTVFHNEFLFVEDSVYVPATGESLPQVTDIQTSILEGIILVSWKAPVQKVSGYMIDYTHNGNHFHWKETNYTNATLFDLLDRKPYNITVTPLFDDKTGHGTQALQICSRVGAEPGNVTITKVQPKDKSALVRWNVKSQEACSGVAVNYTVFYSTPKGPQLNVTVDGTTQDIILNDLDPETQYCVYVKATALTGTTESKQRFFQTKRFDPRLSTVLSICGGILIILVLSLGLCCAIKYKKFREKPVPNPGHSSVALWPSANEKGIWPFQPFHNPSESLCDKVHTEEAQTTSTSPSATGCNDNPATNQTEEYSDPASNQTEEYSDPAITAESDVQNEDPVETVKTQDPPSPGETTKLLSSENRPSTPYQSQSPVETPAQGTPKQYNCVPVKQQEETTPLTVYITLDMLSKVRAGEMKPKLE